MDRKQRKIDWKLAGLGLFFLAVLFAAYSNHFDNGFQFDDIHTIVDNEYIQDIKNIPLFFKDPKTSSSMPGNQAVRPVVTMLNAIDYYLAGGLKPVYFHASMFLWYIIQLVIMYFVLLKIINLTASHRWNSYFALFITAFYGLHTGNAETINYIISRSDLFSTMLIVASLALYMNPKTRRFHLYLVTMVIAQFTKQTGLVFAPLLFLYIMIFEEKLTVSDLVRFRKKDSILRLIQRSAPAFILAASIFLIIETKLSPTSTLVAEAGPRRWHYFMTQQYAILRYIANFFLPVNLSADQTFNLMSNFLDHRILYGMITHTALIIFALASLGKQNLKPISFGILWFYLALAPTSSLHPMFQISNDHRIFFPYIGAALAAGWLVILLIKKYESRLMAKKLRLYGVASLAILVMMGYAYGAHKRSEIWGSYEALWRDAAIKGPENGRALMNYGLTLMQKGQYPEAAEYFDKAERQLPRWCYIHINQALLKNAMGDPVAAEEHFKKAIFYQGDNPESYYHYARFLDDKDRDEEAVKQLEIALTYSPGHVKSKEYLKFMEAKGGNAMTITELINQKPSVENFLNISLILYKQKNFEGSIDMAKKALELDPNSALAWNNACAAYCALKRWDEAINACNKALEIDPGFELAKNNLNWALGGKKGG